jgi:PRTRC genetic system protein E
MFIELEKLLENCDFNITLSKNKEVISAVVIPKIKGNKATIELNPMILSGTAEQFNQSFIGALQTAKTKIDAFTVELSSIDASIEKAKEEKTVAADKKTAIGKKEPVAKAEVPKIAKIDAKAEYDKGVALFNSAKYAEALPFLELAHKTKADNKTYKDKYDICQKWVDRLKESGLFKEEEVAVSPPPVTENKPSEQIFDVVSNKEDAVEVEEEIQFEGPGESEDNAQEDDLQFDL